MAKRHNWVTGPNNKVVSRRVNSFAACFIDHCDLYTPEIEAELDRLLGLGMVNTDGEPDPEVLAMLSEETSDDDWVREPTVEELREIEVFGIIP